MQANNRHYWLKSGTLNLLLNVQSLIFAFGSFFLLVRLLDKHSFGIWALFVATTSIFETARNGLVQNALIKFLSSGKPEEHPAILSASFIISGALMLICIAINLSLATYFARIWNDPELVSMFYSFVIVYLLQGALAQFQWIEQAHLSFQGTVITNFIRQGGFFVLVLIGFLLHWEVSLIKLVYLQGACALLGLTTEYFFVRKYLGFSFVYNKSWLWKLFNYGKFVFGTSLGAILSNTINQMMLGGMISVDAAGVYNVALRITNVADIPTNAVGAIVFPQSARRFAEQGNQAGKYMFEKSVGTILALLVPGLALVLIFPHFVVNVIAGNRYGEAIPIMRITIVTCLFNPFQRMFGTIMDSMGRPKINFILILSFLGVNLLLTYLLVRSSGIMGAVYATFLADLIFFIIMQLILRSSFDVHFINTFRYAYQFYPDFFKTYARPFFVRAGILKP